VEKGEGGGSKKEELKKTREKIFGKQKIKGEKT
jgi:hypothetical protein